MKKALCVLLALLMLLCLCACEDDVPDYSDIDDSVPTSSEREETLSSGKCYSVVEETDADNNVKYSYCISDLDGNVLEQAVCANEPKAAMRGDSLLRMTFRNGDKSFCRYYNLDTGFISESVSNVLWDNGVLLIRREYRTDTHYLVVEGIFPYNSYYESYELDADTFTVTVLSVEQSEDMQTVDITYVPGDGTTDSFEPVTVSINVPEYAS